VERAARWQSLEAVLGCKVPVAPAHGAVGAPKPAPVRTAPAAPDAAGGGDFAQKMRARIQQKQAEARARAAGPVRIGAAAPAATSESAPAAADAPRR
jgi:hypothetical protein